MPEQREHFDTGSVRDSGAGKGRFDLMSPFVLMRDAKHLELGAAKYGDRNWERGQPAHRFIDAAMRHLVKYLAGCRDEDHLAAARWNLGCIMHFEEMVKSGHAPSSRLFEDLPQYVPWDTNSDVLIRHLIGYGAGREPAPDDDQEMDALMDAYIAAGLPPK
jgi:hypothetical protein